MNATIQHYLDEFKQRRFAEGPLHETRRRALALFEQNGFPGPREENWKYTDVRPLRQRPFTNLGEAPPDPGVVGIDAVRFKELDCIELVFINGVYAAQYSRLAGLPGAVTLENLAAALARDGDLPASQLTRYADDQASMFTALNTAFIGHGVYLNIPRGTVVERPINILYLSKANGQPHAAHPRNLLILNEGAEATLIESYIGLDEADYFTNTVSEVALGAGAVLKHYKIQQESLNACHIGSLNVRQDRDSKLESHSIALGGALARNDIHSRLAAEGAAIDMNGLYMPNGQQHIDNHTRVDHLEPRTFSMENYRGVLNGKSHAVFNGKVVVHPQAQKIEAHQNNANLLLSDHAEIDTKPELEIHADDVKCSHGATVGQLDKDMLFYLRARAIDEDRARSLLTYAFADEVISRIALPPIRGRLEYLVVGQLPDAALIREFTHEH